MSSAKIVGIHGVKAPSGGSAKPLAPALLKLRDLSKGSVRDLLRNLFDNADDALFAMADKAGSNGEQAMYFEAMRELRMQKKAIALATLSAVIRSFNEFGRKKSASSQNEDSNKTIENLSLVQEEDLEYEVALEGMVQRLRSNSQDALNALHKRYEHLAGGQVPESQIPVSPEILCQGFFDGCASLEIDITAKLIVFKLFERFILADMPQVYNETNQMLRSLGVLPDLKVQNKVKKNTGSDSSASSSSDASSAPEAANPASLEVLRQLLHPQGTPMSNVTGGDAGAYITQSDLVSVLSNFQLNTNTSVGSNQSQLIDFHQLLDAQLKNASDTKTFSEVDTDVINLVSMLFEFILDDRQLQPQMKAIISRLQIPMLKVAIIDRSFFNKGGHPARKLLNDIASAAIGWNEPKGGRKDRFKEKLEDVVETIVKGFVDDVSMFTGLLEDFNSFVSMEKKRGLLIEQRTKDSEKGRAATESAKKAAQEVINMALKDRAVPDMALEVLRDAWSSVLILAHLKEGTEHKSWTAACQFVDDFVWSMCPDPKEPDARSKLLKQIPSIVKRLREGLREISFDDYRIKNILKGLEDQHVLSLQALQQQIDLQDTAVEAKHSHENKAHALSSEDQDDAVSDLVRSTLELDDDFRQLQDACEQANEKNALLEATNAELPKKQEGIVLIDESAPQESEVLDENDPFMQQVGRFVVGCWFEFSASDNSERCKLAAVIKATDKYIFVNRAGIKVAEHNSQELAKELRRGALQVLNDGLLFDRALESIITNLRSK
jgi:Protein of unknown function (DUF1631)